MTAKHTLVVIIGVALTLAPGCGDSTDNSTPQAANESSKPQAKNTPEGVCERFLVKLESGDFDGATKLCHPSEARMSERELRSHLAEGNHAIKSPIEIKDSRIYGDWGIVVFKYTHNRRGVTFGQMWLRKYKNDWKMLVSFTPLVKAEPEAKFKPDIFTLNAFLWARKRKFELGYKQTPDAFTRKEKTAFYMERLRKAVE